ncbi:MAG: sulfate/molybdate ABC transporter ATP-binding protein [Solirubrobacteraceae bacterium]
MLRVDAGTRLGSFELRAGFDVSAGHGLALAGPAGAGKSTLLRIVAGLLRPDHGRVDCHEEIWLDTEQGVDRPPEQRRCGYVFQHYALFEHMSAWQNVAYALHDRSRARRRAEASRLLERFGISRLANARPNDLSGGERQRVALARALAGSPRALLLDEPLSALDARTRADAAAELSGILRQIDVPAVLVTHDFSEAARLSDDVAIIEGGRLVQRGTASRLVAEPTSAFVADFTGAVVLTGSARPGADGLTLIELEGGGTIATVDPGRGPVAVSVYPWEITIEPADAPRAGAAQNHVAAQVVSITAVGNRVRLGLAGAQPLTAEITATAARNLGLEPGVPVIATWKAAATRLVDR